LRICRAKLDPYQHIHLAGDSYYFGRGESISGLAREKTKKQTKITKKSKAKKERR